MLRIKSSGGVVEAIKEGEEAKQQKLCTESQEKSRTISKKVGD